MQSIYYRFKSIRPFVPVCCILFKQNRESTEGYSKSIVRKNNDKFGKGLVSTNRTYAILHFQESFNSNFNNVIDIASYKYWSCAELYEVFTFLMENIAVQFDDLVYQQILGFLWALTVLHIQYIYFHIVTRGTLCRSSQIEALKRKTIMKVL